jgi:hypothetical protein
MYTNNEQTFKLCTTNGQTMCCDDGDECISERVQFTIYSMRNSCGKLKWLRVEAFVRESGLFYMEQKPVQGF